MFRLILTYILGLFLFWCFSFDISYSQQKGSFPGIIRDTELEELLRDYSSPILRVAGESSSTTEVFIIADDSINAFVAGGRRIFIHTGLLLAAETPNQLIGVIAHEVGHIEGGHLSTFRGEINRANTAAIIGMLAGVAATVAGAATNNSEVARSGSGVMIGSNEAARRLFLSYRRSQESSADQSAIRYLNATRQSPRGMLEFFERLGKESLISVDALNPYTRTHPAPLERLRHLERLSKESPYFSQEDSPSLVLRHKMAQAKLLGFLSPDRALRRFSGKSDVSSRYGLAIAHFRRGRIKSALDHIDILLGEMPNNAYFWEIKGQALFENGRASEAVPALEKALSLAPDADLIRILLGQVFVSRGRYAEAVGHLRRALRGEGRSPLLHYQLALAYGRMGKVGLADLSSAEMSFLHGDIKLAHEKATRAQERLRRGSPEWRRADDILNVKVR